MNHGTSRSPDEQLRSGEVARMFSVNVKTVIRWADLGKIPYTRTPGGERRFRRSDVYALMGEPPQQALALTDAELKAAGDMLARVLDCGWRGPLTDEEALPLFKLLRALPRRGPMSSARR